MVSSDPLSLLISEMAFCLALRTPTLAFSACTLASFTIFSRSSLLILYIIHVCIVSKTPDEDSLWNGHFNDVALNNGIEVKCVGSERAHCCLNSLYRMIRVYYSGNPLSGHLNRLFSHAPYSQRQFTNHVFLRVSCYPLSTEHRNSSTYT